MPDLSVVIPTYRRHAVLGRTLTALAGQTLARERFEVLVVDDPVEDDPDAVAAVIARTGLAARQLHRAGRGVSSARNAGWREAAADVILFLGDDILAQPDLLDRHLAAHGRHASGPVGVLGHVRWADELPRTPLMAWLERGVQSDYAWLDAGGAPSWGHFLTTNASLPRTALERVGGFDEEHFPFLYEDTDLGLRLVEHGLELIYEPRARGEHLHSPTLEDWSRRVAATAAAERRFCELHPGREPHFERRFRAARAAPPARARLARALLPLTRLPVPRLRRFAEHHLDLHYRQLLAPAFLDVWDAQGSR